MGFGSRLKSWTYQAAPWAAAYFTGGLGASLFSGVGTGTLANPAAFAGGAAGTAAGFMGGQALVQPLAPEQGNEEAIAQLTAEQEEKARREGELRQREADAARARAKALTNGRQGSIKTSPLGLPGGGFAQRQLLGG